MFLHCSQLGLREQFVLGTGLWREQLSLALAFVSGDGAFTLWEQLLALGSRGVSPITSWTQQPPSG